MTAPFTQPSTNPNPNRNVVAGEMPIVAPENTIPVPYTAPPPEQTTPVEPPRQKDWDQGSAQQNVRPVFGGGKKGLVGGIAYLADSVLRGAMKGRQEKEMKRFDDQRRLIVGLGRVNDQAAARVIDLAQKPDIAPILQKIHTTPNYKPTPEEQKTLEPYNKALEDSNAAWQSYNTAQNNYLFGGQKQKKSKGGKTGNQAEDPMQLWSSKDPHDKLKGAAMMRTQFGNPVLYQVDSLLSQLTQQMPGMQHTAHVTDLQSTIDKSQQTIAEVSAIPEGNRTDQQKQQLTDAQSQLKTAMQQMEEQRTSTSKTPPKAPQRKNVLLKDGGGTVTASVEYDAATGRQVYKDVSTGEDITGKVEREVGVAINPNLKVEKGGVRMANGQFIAANPATMQLPPDAPPEARDAWATNMEMAIKDSTTSTVTDAHGNVFQRRETHFAGPHAGGNTTAGTHTGATTPHVTNPTGTPVPTGHPAVQPKFVQPAEPNHPAGMTKYDQERLDNNYKTTVAEFDKLSSPIDMVGGRLAQLHDAITQQTPQADALIAPELLSVSVTGGTTGSGLRMNEAEIARIVGGKSHWQKLKSAAQEWRLDPSKPFAITAEQREQINALFDAFARRVHMKQDVLTKYRQQLVNAGSVNDQRLSFVQAQADIRSIDAGRILNMALIEKAAKDHNTSIEDALSQAKTQGYYVSDEE